MNVKENYLNKTDEIIIAALKKMGVEEDSVINEIPPQREMGDVAYPLFKYAKSLRKAPPLIAKELAENLGEHELIESVEVKGPYLNIFLNKKMLAFDIVDAVISQGESFGQKESRGEKVLVEFSSPNTNKPLHLGHCRNNVLGDSISRIMKKYGSEVIKLNLINDRGIHICKSMLAYDRFGNGTTPEKEGRKSDHMVGDFYVKYSDEAEINPGLEKEAQEMLLKWEQKDPEIYKLWEQMNSWAIGGIKETYKRMGISFDHFQYESETYLTGKDIVQSGLERGVFFQKEDGSIWVDNEDVGLDKKIVLRGDGTSVYMTQDLGTAIQRSEKFGFDSLVYVVGSEQIYHFKTLFTILKKLGYNWADNCYHLSYGMVNLPDGSMKSRKGNVVDADNLMDELEELAMKGIEVRHPEWDEAEKKDVATKVGLAALKYYLLNFSTVKDVMFIAEQSISFEGNTGPYLQYTTARINSILRKAEGITPDTSLFKEYDFNTDEWGVVSQLLEFEGALDKAAESHSPLEICNFLYNLAKLYNKFYYDNQVLNVEDEKVKVVRLTLCKAVHTALKAGLELLGIDALERM